MRSRLLPHVLFGVSTLLALIAAVSAVGDLLGWWQSPLSTPVLLSTVAVSLMLTLCARHRRDHQRSAATLHPDAT